MRVHELLVLLKDMDRNAYVVINDRVVASIEEIRGRVGGPNHWPDTFRRVDGGRDKAIVFLRRAELSDGSQELISTHC